MVIMKIKKGDNVIVISGKQKGTTGPVTKVFVEDMKVIVTGVNKVKKHVKPSKEQPGGGILEFEKPIKLGNIMLVCESCKKPVKVAIRRENGKKLRICKKCEAVIK